MRSLMSVLLLLGIVGCTIQQTGPASREQASMAARANTEIASYHLRSGALETALAKVSQALAQDDDRVDAHLVAAEIRDRLAEPVRAERHYRRALSLSGRSGAALNNYAGFLCRAGETVAAVEHWRQAAALRRYDGRAMALSNAAQCLVQANASGPVLRADRYWRRALRIEPDYAPALRGLAEWSLARGELNAAGAWYSRYTASVEENPAGLWLGIRIAGAGDEAARQRALTARLRERFPASEQAARLTE
ncbi:type IV pilus biogenesis/stability protein PilW [Spiribacter aquaticus]|uniref:Type IV pilus biogenesis/stability protein PilW n=2 Tax=Ectothiorhodospiraceae TaxID=72276 RepID=A0A557RJX9_9GAMM|nr:type IV pilus biogenesis/stability protein PilW [Spiribacter roseus]TVO65469.1 type IV pilus biogenesis/stability protein PilW [Spiribacter aquaticus]